MTTTTATFSCTLATDGARFERGADLEEDVLVGEDFSGGADVGEIVDIDINGGALVSWLAGACVTTLRKRATVHGIYTSKAAAEAAYTEMERATRARDDE